MIYIVYSIVAILLCICIVLFLMLLNKKEHKQKEELDVQIVSKKLDFTLLTLPLRINKIEIYSLKEACNKVFDSFNSLDYSSKPEIELEKVEWHSWQVSLVLRLLYEEIEFYIPEAKYSFHNSIKNEKNKTVLQEMYKMQEKYKNHVDVDKSKDALCNDVIWSCREVSILFYYLLNQKTFKDLQP